MRSFLRRLPSLSVVIRTNSQAQFHNFVLRLEASKETMKAMTNWIKPVLDLIDPQLLKPDRRPQSDVIVEGCRSALENFKHYACGIACFVVGHALAVFRSFYPSMKLERIDGGFAQNLSDEQITALEEGCLIRQSRWWATWICSAMLILNHDDM